jgi:YegS/Rv2252/BmrU family lipid kinase
MLPKLRDLVRSAAVEIAESHSQQDLIDLAEQAARQGFDIVAAVGGDGTIHYVLTGIFNAQNSPNPASAALGIIPLGRGNDIARTLNIPEDLEAACRVLLAGKIKKIDLARTGSNVYAGVAGIGFDSEATRLANETKLSGGRLPASFIYTYAVLRALASYRPKRVQLKHDGGCFDGKIMFAVVSNGQCYGGGMRITPTAILDDGLLDVCIVREVSKLQLLRNFPHVFRGSHIGHPFVEYFRASRVEIIADEQMELFGDGEYLEKTPIKIEVARQALSVVVP